MITIEEIKSNEKIMQFKKMVLDEKFKGYIELLKDDNDDS